jgi:3-dehydroquinate dehydratase-2
MTRILVIQGANMVHLGKRQPELYGRTTAAELDEMIRSHAERRGYEVEILYTNHEGEALDRIYAAKAQGVDGLVMNPGGFTYAGRALGDCIKGVELPYVEVHIKNHYQHDTHSVIADAAVGVVMGLGVTGYLRGLDALLDIVAPEKVP